MRVMRGAYFWQFGSIASLPTETTDGEILVAFWGPNMASEAISECQILKNFPWGGGGACPQTPLPCSHLRTRNGRTSPK